MNIDRIYVACHKWDVKFARIAVASIRKWYPTIPISLLKDEFSGRFHTRDIERGWDVSAPPLPHTFGSPFSKLEPLLADNGGERFLVLDADTCLAGPVLDRFKHVSADFVVQPSTNISEETIVQLYFDLPALRRIDPEYRYPGYYFNTGQLVGTSGVFTRADFSPYVDWSARPVRARDGNLFRGAAEESLLNYLLWRFNKDGRLKCGTADFWRWSGDPEIAGVDFDQEKPEAAMPLVIHWAGATRPLLRQMTHASILRYYEKQFYRRLSIGHLRRLCDVLHYSTGRMCRTAYGRLRKRVAAGRK